MGFIRLWPGSRGTPLDTNADTNLGRTMLASVASKGSLGQRRSSGGCSVPRPMVSPTRPPPPAAPEPITRTGLLRNREPGFDSRSRLQQIQIRTVAHKSDEGEQGR